MRMNSPLLALFTRALREDVRSKAMYWARAGLVGIVLLNLGGTQLSMGWAGAPGLVFFNSIVSINLFFISLAGLSYFASAITEEKEDMTLGLLRMTNLNPLSILLGKSASRQIGALLLLLSQLPFTLLAVALGGVTLAQIIAAFACLAAYTLLLGNVALFFSVVMRRSFAAALLTFITMFVFLFGAWIVRNPVLYTLAFLKIIPAKMPPEWVESFLAHWQQASPFSRLGAIGITGFSDGPLCFQVFTNILLALAFFLLAWAVFDVFCNEEKDAAPARGFLTRKGKGFRLFGYGRPGRHALFWKDYYFIGGGNAGAALKLVLYGGLLAFFAFAATVASRAFGGNPATRNPIDWENVGIFTMWTMMIVTAAEIAFVAARIFRQERIWKTWSSLSMLPMSTRRIAYQKIIGALATTWPALLFFTLGAGLVIDDLLKGLGEMLSEPLWIGVTGFVFAILLMVFFYHLVVTQ